MAVLKGLRVGFAFTGSFCTFENVLPALEEMVENGAIVTPIFSPAAASTDTRFGTASHWRQSVEQITGQEIIFECVDAEPIGPRGLLDLMVIAPCTGNTLAKLAHGISDGPVLLGTKAHLRNGRPVLLAIATNDGLGNNAANIGRLLNTKNIYFVPFGQDDPFNKGNSLIAHMEYICQAAEAAMNGEQIQPVLLSYESR